MEMTVIRYDFDAEDTIGLMLVDDAFECYTLEDNDRGLSSQMSAEEIASNKIYGRTAIPTGTYKVAWTYSPKFQRFLPEILGVPGYVGIRMHAGNKADDTDGCVLTGEIAAQDSIQASQLALSKLLPKIEAACAKDDCWITITRIGLLVSS